MPLLAALAILPALLATPPDVGDWVQEAEARGVTTAVVVTRGDEVVALAGEGTFRLESLSKSFTATAVMRLVEDGAIDLDEPVVEHLPELVLDDPRADRITVRQLLNQSSGITDATLGFDQYENGPRTPEEAVRLLRRTRLAFDPGTDWAYSNPQYWVLARLVEVVSGRPFDAYLREEVLDPLGMTATRSAATARAVPARGHSYVLGRAVPALQVDAFVAGAGGLASTPKDMAIWLRFQHGALPGGEQVLSDASLAEMHRRQAPQAGLYALGWYSGPPADGGVDRVSHSGAGAGTSAYQGLFPGGLAVAVLQSAPAPQAYSSAAQLQAWAEGAPLGDPPAAPPWWRDGLALAVLALGLTLLARGMLRLRVWARSAGRWTGSLRVGLGLALAIAVLTLPGWGSLLLGRAATWAVLLPAAPVPVVSALVLSGGVAALSLLRAGALLQARRAAGSPRPS